MQIRARPDNQTTVLTATLTNADSGLSQARITMKDSNDGWMSGDFGRLPEGVYRVVVDGPGVRAVTDLLTVLA